MSSLQSFLAVALVATAQADMYLHNMRGSNNRLDEARRDRNNANRLFDSQNNNRGGSNVGSMYFYEGERLEIEWTNQHGCGSLDNDCQIVVQYMCDERLRDGVTTRTIPRTPSQCANADCNNDARYGMHEDYDYYMNCRHRYRNRGLFTADRNLNGRTARFTRQNNNGNRNGYECPEERDYYPYWHPTRWVDVAIFANDPIARCPEYIAESENVKGRHFCRLVDSWYQHMISRNGNGNNGFIPNTEATCLALNQPGSQMMTYLATQAEQTTQEMQAVAAAEFARCGEAFADLQFQCAGVDPVTSCPAYQAFTADTSKWMTVSDLEAACPVCHDSGSSAGLPQQHPYAFCAYCGPAMCNSSAYAMKMEVTTTMFNATTNVTTVMTSEQCPSGYVEDDLSEWCVMPYCIGAFTQRTTPELIETNSCRAQALTDKVLVEEVSGAAGMYMCTERNVTATSCLATASRATWDMSMPHSARNPAIKAPTCTQAQWSRANQLGNGLGGQANGFELMMPSDIHERCTMRVRYNITTKDYGGFDPFNSGQVNSSLNKRNGNNPAKIDVGSQFEVATTDVTMPYENARGYLWKQNPKVSPFDMSVLVRYCPEEYEMISATQCRKDSRNPIRAHSAFCPAGTTGVIYGTYTAEGCPSENFCNVSGTPMPGYGCDDRSVGTLRNQGGDSNGDTDPRFQLAINTNQFGRTFQDRTHSYAVRRLGEDLAQRCRRIHALNVRGKRGNIVQTFPGTEYDFVPNDLAVSRGDCIHFQWTGSNTNPNNNDGQGKQGTDRSNIVPLEGVRGQGGRGVLRYGGYGKDGTTWTTAGMEPGYADFESSSVPTMFDPQCGSDMGTGADYRPHNVPYDGWKCCSSCMADQFRGPLSPGTANCPTGYTYNQECMVCVNSSATCSMGTRRMAPTDYSGVGYDTRDPEGTSGYLAGTVYLPNDQVFGRYGNSHPEHLDNITQWGLLAMDREQWTDLATLVSRQFRGEMSELDDAGTYHDVPPHRVGGPVGVIRYLCTRNNNFSNRSQKGTIRVSDNVIETIKCSGLGCSVSASSDPTMSGGIGQSVPDGAAVMAVPPKSVQSGTTVGVEILAGMGQDDSQSDVVAVTPGDLAVMPQLLAIELQSTAGGGRRRDATMDEKSGIWVLIAQEDIGGDDVVVSARSPSSMVIQNERMRIQQLLRDAGLVDMLPYMCFTMKWGEGDDEMLPVTLDIPSTGEVRYQITVPPGWIEPFNAALWASTLVVDVGFAQAADISADMNVSTRTCSDLGQYSGTVPVDPESGRPMSLEIPVTASFAYGPIYRWPITERTTACFVDGVGCDSVYNDNDRETIDNAECSGGTCTLERSQSAGGYYQVSSSSPIPMIIGITIACLLIIAGVIGSALYFRRNPQRWDDVKQWGPNKYKQFSRSMKVRL